MQTPTSEFNQGHSTVKMSIHLLSTAVCTFAEVYTAVHLPESRRINRRYFPSLPVHGNYGARYQADEIL